MQCELLLQVASVDVAKLEPITVYIAGARFTLEPRDYAVSWPALRIAISRNTHHTHNLASITLTGVSNDVLN
jgi:hypothetical protein